MKKTLYLLLVMFVTPLLSTLSLRAQEKIDTIYLSTLYTTHIVFTTEVTYADLSNTQVITAKIVEQNKNMIAIKAREPFTTTASVTALESNGSIHTFILKYMEHPKELIIDTRSMNEATHSPAPVATTPAKGGRKGSSVTSAGSTRAGGYNVSTVRKSDAPELKDVIDYPQSLYHISKKSQRVTVTVENIFAYSDITYVTLSLTNKSGVSYEVSDANFIIESRTRSKRKVVTEKNVFPKNRYGSLSAGAGETSRICYSLEKLSLATDQVLKIYVYEQGGQRNIVLTLSPSDVNLALAP